MTVPPAAVEFICFPGLTYDTRDSHTHTRSHAIVLSYLGLTMRLRCAAPFFVPRNPAQTSLSGFMCYTSSTQHTRIISECGCFWKRLVHLVLFFCLVTSSWCSTLRPRLHIFCKTKEKEQKNKCFKRGRFTQKHIHLRRGVT